MYVDAEMDFREGIRSWRRKTGITQAQVASRSGLSVASIRAYETGARNPSHQSLQWIVHALGMPRDEANRIIAGAGYAVNSSSTYNWGYEPVSLTELAAEADSLAWPAFITNQGYDVVHANPAHQRVFEVDLSAEYTGHGERNLIAQAVNPVFASRMLNWDEAIGFVAGLAKADERWHSERATQPAPWLQGAMVRLAQGDPALVQRLLEIWLNAKPRPRRFRHRYNIAWLYRGEHRMHFTCINAISNVSDELHWNEWIPEDSETWRLLSEIGSGLA